MVRPTCDHTPPHTCYARPAQVRPNSIIVFVPKYGIEGPVFLEEAEAAAAAGGHGARPGSAVDSAYVYDEEKQARPGGRVPCLHCWPLPRRVARPCALVPGAAAPREGAEVALVPRGSILFCSHLT